MRKYHQLTQEQRYHIECCSKRGMSQSEIARDMGVHKSTVCRELKRNKGLRGYRHKQAQRKALERRQNKSRHRIGVEVWKKVESRLKRGHSPEAISGRLKLEGLGSVSHESIYTYIYANKKSGGDLYTYLVSQKPRRKKRRIGKDRRGQIVDRVSIEQRPAIVDEVSRLGDWEADTVIGSNHKGVLVTINERLSGINLAVLVASKSAKLVQAAIVEQLRPYRHLVHTITVDNGKEFAGHKQIAQELNCDIYFAHPYSSWERGRNENSNGRLRRFFPKGTSFVNLSPQEVNEAVETMLDTPRKRLAWRTPREVFLTHTGIHVKNNANVALQT